jgi:hypothetical protein
VILVHRDGLALVDGPAKVVGSAQAVLGYVFAGIEISAA